MTLDSHRAYRRQLRSKPEIPLDVLYVEDDVVNIRVTELLLSRLGYDLDIARNGEEAVKAAAEKAYDLILMDLHMPVMDGLEAAIKILENHVPPQKKRRPVLLALTSTSSNEERDAWLDAGMDGFLNKPFKTSDFQEVIKRHFIS